MEYRITLPFLPCSTNAAYRVSKSRVYKSKKLKDFEKQVEAIFEKHQSFEMLEGHLTLDVVFEIADRRSRDLDNMLKSLLDSLEGKVFKNDRDIFEINCRKINNCNMFKTIIVIKVLESD